MDTPQTGTALLLLVAFVLPGFVTLVIQESTYVVKSATSPFERLLLSLSYSVRVYAILFIAAAICGRKPRDVSVFAHGHDSLWDYIVVAALGLIVLPVAVSEAGRHWRNSKRLRPWVLRKLGISESHSTPSGWDHFFGSNKPALVRITLDDGRVVGGLFSSESLAAYSEETGDLFLEQRWVLDDDAWFKEPAQSSIGLWVPSRHMVSVEVYDPWAVAEPTTPAETVQRAKDHEISSVVVMVFRRLWHC